MILPIFGVLAAAVAALLGYAATKPGTFRVQRSTIVQAPPETIFPLLRDFHRWEGWSPYEKLDPTMHKTFSGPDTGPGSVYEWTGNKKAGAGRMEIIGESAPTELRIKLDFTKPFESHNTTLFTLEPANGATRVTWAIQGPNPFISKVMGVFIDMDELVGRDFETGLANLKAATERGT